MKKVYNKIQALVEDLDYYLYDIAFGPRDGNMVLSVEIDHPKGINIDDCVTVSEAVSVYLDETDPINQSYHLEVTSAGAERELRNLDEITRAHGKYVHVNTIEQTHEGVLELVTDTSITIREKQKQKTTILLADVQKIRLAIDL